VGGGDRVTSGLEVEMLDLALESTADLLRQHAHMVPHGHRRKNGRASGSSGQDEPALR
jgi:hypothetical protein